MDGTMITGIILVTVGAMSMLPHLISWSDGGRLTVRHLTPGLGAQCCGCAIGVQLVSGPALLFATAAAWLAVGIAMSQWPGATRTTELRVGNE